MQPPRPRESPARGRLVEVDHFELARDTSRARQFGRCADVHRVEIDGFARREERAREVYDRACDVGESGDERATTTAHVTPPC